MNKAKLKTYAPQARKDFIAAVTARANQLGLSEKAGSLDILSAERQGDVTLIAGREWAATVHAQRERLIHRLRRDGFSQTMEAVAYTWFNRIAALRFMELHDYLVHGHRVLSSTAGGLPDILAHATELAANKDLPGLNADFVAELTLAGNKDGELYRLLLVAQCNALSAAMPFLFERIDDETELLLPDNLLRTDSIIARLVEAIPEEDWPQVEIIGWLYQFYISEKKDEVIGKVVRSEDIPAATQLFTPNWIVQYLVQNSIGRLWMMANPASTLKSQWPYYIEPAEQTPEVNAQLDALIQTRMEEDGGSLNPETITVLDPACGSGHILVEAYEVLKAIYLERGYRLRDIPRLILEKNLYGLDIDDRAAQMAGFALLMKARADDRRLFNDPPKLNVLSLQESKGLALDDVATHLAPFGMQRGAVKALLDTFEHAKTFGSLIQISDTLNAQLPAVAEALGKASETGDLYARAAAQDLMPLVEQVWVLRRKFDAVVANPPYMGTRYQSSILKDFVASRFKDVGGDIYACFIRRLLAFGSPGIGQIACVAPYTWMFLGDYEKLRDEFLSAVTLSSIVKLEYNAFEPAAVPVAAWSASSSLIADFDSSFIELADFKGSEVQAPRTLEAISLRKGCGWYFELSQTSFERVPGKPFVFWISSDVANAFSSSKRLSEVIDITGSQTVTANNSKYLRLWFEVSKELIGSADNKKWKPYAKGGSFRRWYGNIEWVVNWSEQARSFYKKNVSSSMLAEKYWYREGITYTDITTLGFTARYLPPGCLYDKSGPSLHTENLLPVLSFLNSSTVAKMLSGLNPTMHCQVKDISALPGDVVKSVSSEVSELAGRLIEIYRTEWDFNETSLDFGAIDGIFNTTLGVLKGDSLYTKPVTSQPSLKRRVDFAFRYLSDLGNEALDLQKKNDQFYANIMKVVDADRPVKDGPIVTFKLPWCEAGRGDGSDAEQTRFYGAIGKALLSYAIGCMMGRYSLDEPGLIYAHAGNVGFDQTRYKTFPADADGIVPMTDEFWFEDDAANRVREFLSAVWGTDTLDENMAWLAESRGRKGSEIPDETIRRYLADKFFKDHLQTYKKRPIYWLFSSGKQGAFQALVYLHRYHEGTLARLRAEYVVPLTGKMQDRIEILERDATAASSAAARSKLNKEIEKLRKKHVELLAYDEKLRHHADLRIQLDLDDGVKVNYGKFGDLLAEVKAVTGGTADE